MGAEPASHPLCERTREGVRVKKRKPTLEVRAIPDDMWNALQSKATERGVSIHVIVRAALRLYLGLSASDITPCK